MRRCIGNMSITVSLILSNIIIRFTTIVKKTGIVPKGLVNVKKEVKHNKAKGIRVSIMVVLYGYH